MTLGIQPSYPSTDYGYLRPDTMRGEKVDGVRAYPLLGFEEKPTEARARELINMPGVAWNAGHVRLAAGRDPGGDREVHAADDADRTRGGARSWRSPRRTSGSIRSRSITRSWRARPATTGS